MSTIDRDRAFVWRPYTSSEDHASRNDPVIVGAEGCWLHTQRGEKLFDATGSWWTNNLGYGHPRLRAALRDQVDSLPHVAMSGCTHEPAAKLAEQLVAVGPRDAKREMARVFFSDNGSTSVEIGLKMALQYWQQNGAKQRTRFLALPGAYHGDTIGAMSVGGMDEFVDVFRPLLFHVNDAPMPENTQEWEAAIGVMIEALNTRDDIAGVIVEPIVQGAAGMRMYAPALLKALRDACDEADTFLIADEVFTGVGRAGSMWACELADVAPDILCTAKGLSGGMLPFAATLATERIYDGFRGDMSRALLHGHTFYGNPLGARVALEVLAVYRDEKILEAMQPKATRLKSWVEGLPGVRRPRACGMIAAFDLGDTGYYGTAGRPVADRARERGVVLRPLGDTLYVVPPLNVADEDLTFLLNAVSHSL